MKTNQTRTLRLGYRYRLQIQVCQKERKKFDHIPNNEDM